MSILNKFAGRKTGRPEWIIAGLGNPGPSYANTRHNVGFRVLDILADQLSISVKNLSFQALTGRGSCEGQNVLLLKPQTYMNLSGQAVGKAARFYKIAPEKIIVIHDDLDLPVGKLRVRKHGSSGGHNGIQNIQDQLHSDQFPHVKIGIGSPAHPDHDVKDWVLGLFAEDEKAGMERAYELAAEAVREIIRNGVDSAMNKFNGLT